MYHMVLHLMRLGVSGSDERRAMALVQECPRIPPPRPNHTGRGNRLDSLHDDV